MKILLLYPEYPATFLEFQVRPQVHSQKGGLTPSGPSDDRGNASRRMAQEVGRSKCD